MDKTYKSGEQASLFDFFKTDSDSSNANKAKKSNLLLSMRLEKQIDPLSWVLGRDFYNKDFELFIIVVPTTPEINPNIMYSVPISL